ncbi:MAG TPA: SRPBCC family protein [Jiangellaceae bacterium]|nr:SRPBCC family protein [Jiangellaceae bacterium]
MQLEHEFTVPVPVDRAWEVLLDVETVAPCMPGASIDTVDGDSFTGKVKVKVGPITVAYAGNASFLEKDANAHRAVVEAKGRETRGSGTAAATVTAQMTDEGGSTRVNVLTDLAITGKPAQFGRGVMNDVGNKLIGQFADCLASTITEGGAAASGEEASAASASPDGSPARAAAGATEGATQDRPTPEAIDLLDVAGGSVAKRLAPVAALVVVIAIVWALVRRRRR